jgi:hypothetical protein
VQRRAVRQRVAEVCRFPCSPLARSAPSPRLRGGGGGGGAPFSEESVCAGGVGAPSCPSAADAMNSTSAMMAMRAMRDNGKADGIVAGNHTSAFDSSESTSRSAGSHCSRSDSVSPSPSSVCSPPHPDSGLPESGISNGRNRVNPTSAGEGLGVGVGVGWTRLAQQQRPPHPSPNASRACPTCARSDATRASPGRVGEGADRVCGADML